MNLGEAAKDVLSFLASASNYGPAVLGAIQQAVQVAEGTGKSGEDKLTSVLNLTEAFAAKVVPLLLNNMQAFMAAVAAFIKVLVDTYNDLGLFVHGVEAALTGKA